MVRAAPSRRTAEPHPLFYVRIAVVVVVLVLVSLLLPLLLPLLLRVLSVERLVSFPGSFNLASINDLQPWEENIYYGGEDCWPATFCIRWRSLALSWLLMLVFPNVFWTKVAFPLKKPAPSYAPRVQEVLKRSYPQSLRTVVLTSESSSRA